MDTQEQKQELCKEIAEIEVLLEKWRSVRDAETRWAISLIEPVLARKKRLLREIIDMRSDK
jgi:cell shape-determining protein MreC